MSSSPESSRTDIASNIKIIPIQSKKKFPAPFKSGAFGQLARPDANRGITESSREYLAEKTEAQLHPYSTAANLDISSIRDTLLHMNNVMAKNTGERIAAVTDIQDAREEEEDRLGKREGTGVAPTEPTLDPFGITKVNPSVGKEWFSTSFSQGSSRSYNMDAANYIGYDSIDPEFYMNLIGDSNATINAGEIEVDGGSPRIYVEGPWENTEQTAYIRFSFPTAQPAGMYIHSGARSNHEVFDGSGNRCGFGRYVAKFDHGRASGPKTACDKEVMHPIHTSEEVDAQPFSGFFTDKWIGIKQITRTIAGSSRVKVEAWVDDTGGLNGGNWVKNSEWTDDGSIPIDPVDITTNQSFVDACMISDDPYTPLKVNSQPPASTANLTQVWLDAARHCWWRIENCDKVRFKWMSVREIDPLPPQPEEPVEEVPELDTFGVLKMFPTTSGGDEWFSTAWQNGTANNRFLGEGDSDPFDSRLHYSNGDPDTTEVRIDGNSHLWQTEFNDSCRLYVEGNWLNTESTIFMRRETGDTFFPEGNSDGIQLRSRSNHQKSFAGETPDDCGWGNYEVKWNDRDDEASVEVEPLHSIYRRHLGSTTFTHTFDIGQWKGFKMITRTIESSDHVLVEGYYCSNIAQAGTFEGWEKVTEFEFDGTNASINLGSNQARADSCFNKGDHQVSSSGVSSSLDAATLWNNTGLHCWMRANGFNNVRFKWYSVREIDAIGAAPAPPIQTDTFGTKKLYTDKSGGSSWAATAWTNGSSRTINRDEADTASTCYNDPSDSRFKMTGVGDPRVVINGSGILKMTVNNNATGSPRVVVTGNFQNVESTIYARFPTSSPLSNFDLRSKTDHYCSGMGDDGFGGYIGNADFETQQVCVRKEKTHAIGYGPRTDIQSFTFTANKWYGFKTINYNVGGNVKVEAWLDTTDGLNGGGWVKISEGTDDGTWLDAPDQLVCGFSGLRVNIGDNNGYVEFKKWTVREITSTPL